MICDGKEVDILIENVLCGDLICVRLGEKIFVDGIVKEGKSSIDELMLIGEFMLIEK